MRQRQQVGAQPLHHDHRQDGAAYQRQPQAGQESSLQLEPAVEPAQKAIVPVEAPAPGVGLGVEAEAEDLEADDAEDRGEDGGDTRRRPSPESHQAEEYREVEEESGGE